MTRSRTRPRRRPCDARSVATASWRPEAKSTSTTVAHEDAPPEEASRRDPGGGGGRGVRGAESRSGAAPAAAGALPQRELVRFVARDGELVTGRGAPGRGVYTCRQAACFEQAAAHRGFARALRQGRPGRSRSRTLYTERLAWLTEGTNRIVRSARAAAAERPAAAGASSSTTRRRVRGRTTARDAAARRNRPPREPRDRPPAQPTGPGHRRVRRHRPRLLAGARRPDGRTHQDPDGPRADARRRRSRSPTRRSS